MRNLPSGTVTLLFTDIEGSTRLLQELGDGYAQTLAQHRRELRIAFSAHHGIEVDTQGDALFYAFARASDAVAAAAAGQRALATGPIRVRMGVHTGEPLVTDEGYVGIDVHRGARIAAAGHGRQILLSQTTQDLVAADVRDLGLHRLKDLPTAERIFQLGEGDFPPLQSLNRTNLPLEQTTFLGREREIGEVVGLLRRKELRILTLTGTGGTGKTRLALQAATCVVDDFEHGVWWVPLAGLQDPQLVPEAVAQVLDASDELKSYIGSKHLLLLLDNFEQILDAAPSLADLSAACENLELLVTSREPLHVTAEKEYVVLPLVEPEAAALFRDRAFAAEPEEAVLEICRRLDCLPLAIELAAARTRALSPVQLLDRLEPRLPWLSGGPRDAPPRHRTLRATIEWSFSLLKTREQHLFGRLSVFAGGCTVEAAEAVCDAGIDALQSLVEKGLLRAHADRLAMLETTREYAYERLVEWDEAEKLSRKHAEYFLALVESARADSGVAWGQVRFFENVEAERDNVLTAFAKFSASAEYEKELRLAAAMAFFWRTHGPVAEGRRRLEKALARGNLVSEIVRADALHWAAALARKQGDVVAARRHAGEQLALQEEVGDSMGIARALVDLGVVLFEGLDFVGARPLLARAMALTSTGEDSETAARTLFNFGLLEALEHNQDSAEALLSESYAMAGRLSDQILMGACLVELGDVAREQGRLEESYTLLKRGLRLLAELGSREDAANCVDELAVTLARQEHPEAAALLLGSAEAMRESVGIIPTPLDRDLRQGKVSAVQSLMNREAYSAAVARGRATDFEQAVNYALEY